MKNVIVFFMFSILASNTVEAKWKNELSIKKAYKYALENNYHFPKSESELVALKDKGDLVSLDPNSEYYDLIDVRYPYVRKETLAFVEKLSVFYKNNCGEKLGVTGGSRHAGFKPSNSHPKTVHDTGMAVDLRNSTFWISKKCFTYLRYGLNKLSEAGLIDFFPEKFPPHYHIMVYGQKDEIRNFNLSSSGITHTVVSGDNLSSISREYGVSLGEIILLNGIKHINIIKIGQKIKIP